MTRIKRSSRTLRVIVAGLAIALFSSIGGIAPLNAAQKADAKGPLVIQSRLGQGEAESLQKAVDVFNAMGSDKVIINTVPNETFRSQLPSYLTAANPPDILTLYGGSLTRQLADKGLLLNLSDIWKNNNQFSKGLRVLSQDSKGREVFVPTSYYWLGVYYKKDVWANAGAKVPKNWGELITASKALKAAGVTPVGIGLSDAKWLASAWFDYMNLRINGAKFHQELLAGKRSFEDPKVTKIFKKWDELKPYFDPNAPGLTFGQAATDLIQGKTGMFLAGSWFTFSLPAEDLESYDYFQFPIIDSAVPLAEEGPTDGYVASAFTEKPKLVKKFLTYLMTPKAQAIMANANPSGTVIPANPKAKVELGAAAIKGRAILQKAVGGVTQFFNRDSSDALQATADQALTQYLASVKSLPEILKEWQTAAKRVKASG